jgi:hypothetical protein
MDKELKIVISIFLVYFIFGIGSFFNSGSFTTPIFLNQLTLVAVAAAFFVMNIRLKHSILLCIFFIIQLISTFIDGFSANYLAQKFDLPIILRINESISFAIFYLIIYFGFFIFITLYLYRFSKVKWGVFSQLLLIAITLLLFSIEGYSWLRDIFFFIYLLNFYTVVNRFLKKNNQLLAVLSYQFLLLFLLESLEYLF